MDLQSPCADCQAYRCEAEWNIIESEDSSERDSVARNRLHLLLNLVEDSLQSHLNRCKSGATVN